MKASTGIQALVIRRILSLRNPRPAARRSFPGPGAWSVLALAALVFARNPLMAQNVQAFTKATPKAPVLVLWEADSKKGMFTQYFVYRKLASGGSYPSTPLNSEPLEPMRKCSDFQSVIPAGSVEWTTLSRAFSDMSKNPPLVFKDVCSITAFTAGSAEWQRVQLFAKAWYKVALVMGQAFIDSTGSPGQTYTYQVRMAVSDDQLKLPSTPQIAIGEAGITAGAPAKIPSPENVRCVPGDSKVQVLWNKPPPASSLYTVVRGLAPGGPFAKINEADVSMTITIDIDSNTVSPAANGFTDYERWGPDGTPKPRTVPGNPAAFTGPSNGTAYYYKVLLRDIFGNERSYSSPPGMGKPVENTPPATPTDLIVTPNEEKSSFEIRWRAVRFDVEGRREMMGGYKVFRYEMPGDPKGASVQLAGVVPQPADSSVFYVSKEDNTGGLRSACGDIMHYFRVLAVDASGIPSKFSVAAGAALKDTTGPASPTGVKAEQNGNFIRVKWKPVKDCDVERYNIYRAYCDYGVWRPCAGLSESAKATAPAKKSGKPGDCGGPFELRGAVSQADAEKQAAGGFAYFDDAPPPGSPVCYAYLVKSQDSSQNLSGAWPVTDPDAEEIVCQRLRDKIPPEAAVISGLFSLDDAIRVEYIGPPIQDIAAYHVYRSEAGEPGPYKWIGGMTVAAPPGAGSSLSEPYEAPAQVGCDSIALVSKPYMSAGVFVDRKIDPKTIYWYKVLGVDLNGNETELESAVGMSTFTFAVERAPGPVITGITPIDAPCGLRINWTPSFESESMLGFAVFRGASEAGAYMQLGTIVQGASYEDRSAARGTPYWYKVSLLKKNGLMTSLSSAKSGMHP